MSNNKIVVSIGIILIISIIGIMIWDFFGDNKNNKNVYEYSLDEYNNEEAVKYSENLQIKPGLSTIRGVTVDYNDNIYVTGDGKVEIYSSEGILQKEFNIHNNASCIATDKNQLIYLGIVDHIEIWNNEGDKISEWNTINDKTVITSITINDTSVFVSDAGNKIVHHYNNDGVVINQIGEKDSVSGIQGFVIPSPYFDVAMGRDGEVWAVNSGRHQLEAYNPDGNLISSWKKSSMGTDGFSGCCNPSHIALLSDGSFVTSEKGIVRIKIHEPSGKFRCMVASPDQFEKGTKGLDLAVDSNNRIIVLDPVRNIIRVFELINK
jgi:beta-propeller repeat-containing protein